MALRGMWGGGELHTQDSKAETTEGLLRSPFYVFSSHTFLAQQASLAMKLALARQTLCSTFHFEITGFVFVNVVYSRRLIGAVGTHYTFEDCVTLPNDAKTRKTSFET